MIAAVLWALCAQAPPEPPRFAAAVTSVYVDAFVTRAGKPLSGLQAADFELFDNGVKQQVVLVDRAAAQVGAVLVLDTSGSVEGAPLEGLRAAARAFVERLGSGDEMALVSFSHSVQLAAQTTDPAAFARALDGLQAGSATSLYDAIYAGARLPLRAPRRLMVVFTDGADNTSWLAPDDVRTALASSGLLLYVITARDRPASEPHPENRRPPPRRSSDGWRSRPGAGSWRRPTRARCATPSCAWSKSCAAPTSWDTTRKACRSRANTGWRCARAARG